MYTGVDVGPIEDEQVAKIARTGKFPHTLFENCNFLELELKDLDPTCGAPANVVVSFEVLEHVEPSMMMKMLEHMKLLTSDDARFFISTPNWNRTDCAANHVNEMLYEALGAAFERHGFVIEHVYGTFASIRDYIDLIEDAKGLDVLRVFEQLREYYDTNFLSCVFAPLFPAQSRNALWELRKARKEELCDGVPGAGIVESKFGLIETVQRPWSSSAKWEDMAL
jgi:hypothetical protein